MAKQRSNGQIEREEGDACPRELCGGTLKELMNGTMQCHICKHSFNRIMQPGEGNQGKAPVIVPDAIVTAYAKAHFGMMHEVAQEQVHQPGEAFKMIETDVAWAALAPHVRDSHRNDAKRVLEKVWLETTAHFLSTLAAEQTPSRPVASPAAEEMRALLTEIAIPSLKYCEDKYGHDDQARLNLEAGIGVKS